VYLGGQNLKFPIVFKSAENNGNFYVKSVMVFGLTLIQMFVVHEIFTGCLY